MKVIYSNSLEDTKKIADEISKRDVKVIALVGDIGVGKTTFTSFYAKNLNIDDVRSPTFSIVNEYENEKLIHMDLYRLSSEEELFDIGFDEYLNSDSIVIIEWPEVAIRFLEDALFIKIENISDGKRKFTIGGRDDISI